MLAERRPIGSAPIEAAPGEWRSVQVRFEPVLEAQAYTLRLELEGNGWLDAVQVAQESELGERYTSGYAAEVALGTLLGEAAAARIQFQDEPAEVQYAVTGMNEGRTLRVRVVNVYGQAYEPEPVPLEFGYTRYGGITYLPERDHPFGRHPYGAFRVEAWVEDDQGTRVSPMEEIVLLRVPRPPLLGPGRAGFALWSSHQLHPPASDPRQGDRN
ncbi:MAG: hypothetical protein KatS3mg115_1984 [Candidatus Poribacteria bacterium]|nr:MAG: hypothetical protein KatS3mg115_1984 [Candidatus Poribacteria bacterium]